MSQLIKKYLTYIKFLIFICTFIGNGYTFLLKPSEIYARTIALVYDDSTSMWGEVESDPKKRRKWIYANYAAQTLASLLRKDDRFIAIRMSQLEVEELNIEEKKDLERIKNKWIPYSSITPYESIELAMNEILKSDTMQSQKYDEQKQDWIIVMTDGVFSIKNKKLRSKKDYELIDIKNNINEFIKKSRGKVRIAFVLIGEEADTIISDTWKRIAPDQVNVLNVKPQDISSEMRRIAAFITGRDFQYTEINRKHKSISFRSLFPIHRIIVYEQASYGRLAKVKSVYSNADTTPTFKVDERYIQNHPESNINLSGKVTTISGNNIFSEGEYIVNFYENIESRNIQILIETAVDLKISIFDRTNNNELQSKSGVFKSCMNDQLEVNVEFVRAGTQQKIYVSKEVFNNFQVNAHITDSQNIQARSFIQKVEPDFNKQSFKPIIKVISESQSFFVEGIYRGYFNLKSNVFTIKAQDCVSFYVYDQNMTVIDNFETIQLCAGTRFRLFIQLMKQDNALDLDDVNLAIHADIDGNDILLTRKDKQTFKVELPINKTKQKLNIEAKWSDLFDGVRRFSFHLHSQDCEKKISFVEEKMNVPYIYSETPQVISHTNYLKAELKGNDKELLLFAHGIPDGITINFANHFIHNKKNKILLKNYYQDASYPCEILRTRKYIDEKPAIINVCINHGKETLENNHHSVCADFSLIPTRRNISFSPLQWDVSFDAFDQIKYKINIQSNNAPIVPMSELSNWKIENFSPDQMKGLFNIDAKASQIVFTPESMSNFRKIQTAIFHKSKKIDISIQTYFPLEKHHQYLVLNIRPVSKLVIFLLILKLALPTLFFCVYTFACLLKSRFNKRAAIRWQGFKDDVPFRPETVYLAGKFKNSLFTWLTPLTDKKTIGGLTFKAGPHDTIIIDKSQQKSNISMDDLSIDFPWKTDLCLRQGNKLVDNTGLIRYEYRYITI